MKIKQRMFTGLLALTVGCLVNYFGDMLLGIRLELYYGLSTFNFIWFLQLFILPILVGLSVSAIFGLGGKWLCYFPPVIVRVAAYYDTQYRLGIPDNTDLMPFGWYIFFIILAVESAAIGGVFGEILVKRVYGRTSPEDAARNLIQPEKKKAVLDDSANS